MHEPTVVMQMLVPVGTMLETWAASVATSFEPLMCYHPSPSSWWRQIEDMSRTKQSVENHVLDSHAKQGCANTHLRSKFSAAHAPSDILLNTANILTLNYARSD